MKGFLVFSRGYKIGTLVTNGLNHFVPILTFISVLSSTIEQPLLITGKSSEIKRDMGIKWVKRLPSFPVSFLQKKKDLKFIQTTSQYFKKWQDLSMVELFAKIVAFQWA